MRTIKVSLALLLFPGVPVSGAVDRLRIIVENNAREPGMAQVWCPHLQKWLRSDSSGLIPLPEPYVNREIITIEPKNTAIYGPRFTRIFPVEDGIISLRAIPVTAAIRNKAVQLQLANRPAEAATAFALTARRVETTDQAEAEKNQRQAFESLAKKYGVSPAWVGSGNTLRASPQLVAAINAKLGKLAVREDGRFSVDDFKKAAEMKSLAPIVAATQEKFFDRRVN